MRDKDSPERHGIWKEHDYESSLLKFTFGNDSTYGNFPNVLSNGTILLITDGEYNMNIEVELDTSKLESISTIEAQLSLK